MADKNMYERGYRIGKLECLKKELEFLGLLDNFPLDYLNSLALQEVRNRISKIQQEIKEIENVQKM